MEDSSGGLSIFGTDFASREFSWAANLYQKWENIFWENITVQDPCHPSKFVDAVSEQFRKICEEVADDWLNPFSDGCVKGPVSDLSLEQDVIAEICEKSKIGHDESPINEGSLISISSEEDMSISIGQDVREEACEVLNKKDTTAPAEVKVCSCSSEVREDHEENSPNFVNHPGPPSSDDGVLSECPENIAERDFGPSNCAIQTEENGTFAVEEDISLVQSIANVCEEQCNSSEPDVPLSPRELDDTNVKENDEFEDVKLEDLSKENYEFGSVPHRAVKNCSYKKKLKDMFNSSFYSPRRKSSNNGAHLFDAINVVLEGRDITTASSVSSEGLSTTESCEPEWELI